MHRTIRLAVLAALAAFALSIQSHAHEIRPTIATVDLSESGRFTLTLSANLEALMAGIGSEHKDTNDAPGAAEYNALRALPDADLRAQFEQFVPKLMKQLQPAFDGQPVPTRVETIAIPSNVNAALARISSIKLSGDIPNGARAFRWTFPIELGGSVLRVKRAGSDELETDWVKAGATSTDIPIVGGQARSWITTFIDYVRLGFTHILPLGIDHILFILGLFLLSTKLQPLLVQITAFTIAHSFTLALGLYGLVEVPAKIVEPLIALSIVFVAVENLFTSRLTKWRPFVIFGFGLLHGLGFAGILQELGLPRDQYLVGLVGFNVGVELGQLAVIALAWLVSSFWFQSRPWYRTRLVLPASAAIAAVGLFWTIERIWFG
jgi:hydrogenase/urease accessory protein HupE